MNASLHVFGFGSLIFAPELPDRLLSRHPALLEGHRRAFNKRSRARSCPRHLSFDAFPHVDEAFRAGGVNHSLALGTVADPSSSLAGVILEYGAEDSEEVLRLLDVREGYGPERPSIANGYLRERVHVRREDSGERQEVWMYRTNPDPNCLYHVDLSMTLEERAHVLINATPRVGETIGDDPAVRGLHYLEGVRRDLSSIGIQDPDLEAIASAVRRLDGPWRGIVAP